MEFKDIVKESYYYDKTGMLLKGDCLDWMSKFPDNSVDMILADLPYGVTKNKWDSIIPLDLLWKQYERIIKESGAIVLFGQDKFTAKLMLSNEKLHRYNLIWNKVLSSGFLNANRQPLRGHEDITIFNTDIEMVIEHGDICLFYKKQPLYNPQKTKGVPSHSKGKGVGKKNSEVLKNNNYGDFTLVETIGDMKHPTSILTFSKPHPSISLHPTQKPVELLEWLIKTYTKEAMLVLDNTAGVCSTAIAAKSTNRKWICIEQEEKYCQISKDRLLENK